MAAEKRPASDVFGSNGALVVKRPKSDANGGNELAVSSVTGAGGALIHSSIRSNSLPAPVMELTGHAGEVFAARFDPSGELIASGSMDRSIMLWKASGTCENYGQMTGHKGAVLDVQWARDSQTVFSASADCTLACWDLETGLRLRRFVGHEDTVNAIEVSRRGQEMLVSVSDDGCVGLWDARSKNALDFIETEYPVTAVALAEVGSEIYTGGIDEAIKVWDMRKKAVVYTLAGHNDTVTSLQISPDSQSLLSNSHDATVRTWDIRPFAPTDRAVQTYDGAQTGIDRNLIRASWDIKGERIATGSADRSVVMWDVRTARLLAKLPGHKGTVNDVRFSPNGEPIDRSLMLGELGR